MAIPTTKTITMGGTLARYSAAGVRTVVVTCTTGDLGEVRDPTLVGQDVATVRAEELQAACRVLGVAGVIQLGYGDSGMAGTPENDRPIAFCNVPLEVAAARLVEIVERERPDVMLAYDETGGYGHPDHVRAHEVAVAAYRAAPEAIRPRRLYFVRFPLSWSRAFVRSLREAGIDAPGSAPAGADAGPLVTEIGVADELVTTVIDVRSFVPLKLAALASYHSQMPPDHFLWRMSPALAAELWSRECFSRESGTPDSGADLFDGL